MRTASHTRNGFQSRSPGRSFKPFSSSIQDTATPLPDRLVSANRCSSMSTELLPGFEPTGVLLSIRPDFAKLIASGAKTVELRRRFPDLAAGSILVLYATKPTAAVIGLAHLRSITTASLPGIWKRFGEASGVSKQTFDQYFDGCIEGLAIEVADFAPLVPPLSLAELQEAWPDFAPPQSYRYVPEGVLRGLRSSVRGGPASFQRRRAAASARPARRASVGSRK